MSSASIINVSLSHAVINSWTRHRCAFGCSDRRFLARPVKLQFSSDDAHARNGIKYTLPEDVIIGLLWEDVLRFKKQIRKPHTQIRTLVINDWLYNIILLFL